MKNRTYKVFEKKGGYTLKNELSFLGFKRYFESIFLIMDWTDVYGKMKQQITTVSLQMSAPPVVKNKFIMKKLFFDATQKELAERVAEKYKSHLYKGDMILPVVYTYDSGVLGVMFFLPRFPGRTFGSVEEAIQFVDQLQL